MTHMLEDLPHKMVPVNQSISPKKEVDRWVLGDLENKQAPKSLPQSRPLDLSWPLDLFFVKNPFQDEGSNLSHEEKTALLSIIQALSLSIAIPTYRLLTVIVMAH